MSPFHAAWWMGTPGTSTLAAVWAGLASAGFCDDVVPHPANNAPAIVDIIVCLISFLNSATVAAHPVPANFNPAAQLCQRTTYDSNSSITRLISAQAVSEVFRMFLSVCT